MLVYQTEPLQEPLRVAGQPFAHLVGLDQRQRLGLGREDHRRMARLKYPTIRNSAATSRCCRPTSCAGATARIRQIRAPSQPDKALAYTVRLPNVSHTFLPGHRLMVQIQSTWFPLYDRNPQKFVPNIMFAQPEDFTKATQRSLAHAGKRELHRAAGGSG